MNISGFTDRPATNGTASRADLDALERRITAPRQTTYPALNALIGEALSTLAGAGIELDHIELDTGRWNRPKGRDHLWYRAESGVSTAGRAWLMVTAGNLKETGDPAQASVVYKSWTIEREGFQQQADRADIEHQLEQRKAEREQAEAERHQMGREQAETLWHNAQPASPNHQYLARKGVGVHGIRQYAGVLLIPVRDAAGALCGLQRIALDGGKQFSPGSDVKGHFHVIGDLAKADRLVICEGYATGASIHESTGDAVIIAFNCGNLIHAAKALRDDYPQIPIVIAGDDDRSTDGNPGRRHAERAAKAVGGVAVFPTFPANSTGTDFNDMKRGQGAAAVARVLELAAAPQWPEPQPIPTTLCPVESFDMGLLPVSLRDWIADVSERMQCPPDFPAVGAMVALSSVIGRKAVIRPKLHDDWAVVPNLWGAVVGRPGIMKSPALSAALAPLDRLQAKANSEHKDAKRDYARNEKLRAMQGKSDEAKAQKLIAQGKRSEAEQLLIEAENDADNSDAPPVLRRYRVTDASVEALGEILIENPFGTLAYRDELHGLLASMDKEGQEGARSFYLQGYDGNQGYTFDRIVRGRHLHIPAVCLALLGGIQPGKLKSYVRAATEGANGDDGLLQRFSLIVWPDVAQEWRDVDRWPETEAKNRAFAVFERLDAMAPAIDPDTGESAPAVFRFSPIAQGIFKQWRAELEQRLRDGSLPPALESHLSKYRKLVPAIALVCALADNEAEVSEASLLRALAWSEYLESHAKRVYAAGMGLDLDGAVALLAKIKAGCIKDGFKPSDVYLKGWASLATPKDVGGAARILCDLGYLRRDETPPQAKGGRPSVTYSINPLLSTE